MNYYRSNAPLLLGLLPSPNSWLHTRSSELAHFPMPIGTLFEQILFVYLFCVLLADIQLVCYKWNFPKWVIRALRLSRYRLRLLAFETTEHLRAQMKAIYISGYCSRVPCHTCTQMAHQSKREHTYHSWERLGLSLLTDVWRAPLSASHSAVVLMVGLIVQH